MAANLDKLHNMADALLKHETIDQDQISDIMAGAIARDKSDSSGTNTNQKVIFQILQNQYRTLNYEIWN